MGSRRRREEETRGEQEDRVRGNFDQVESKLSHYAPAVTSFVPPWLRIFDSLFRKGSPLPQRADPKRHMVWLFDSTAYQAPQSHGRYRSRHHKDPGSPSWQVEVVACVFEKHGGEDLGKITAMIADMVGVDGQFGMDEEAIRRRIAERVRPFLTAVVPARFVTLDVPLSRKLVRKYRLKHSNGNGIISQTLRIGETENEIPDGAVIRPSVRQWPRKVSMHTKFASPDGWAIISDVDDTIKHTMTSDAIGILTSTFVDDFAPIPGMPQLYYHIHKQLTPTWFYLSASPYNLYPFLRPFIRSLFPHGMLLLRENSWMNLPGLLKSFTKGTQAYKVGRMERLHSWFPKRKVLCIGDSTQSDPEAFAEMYRKQRKWIRAIFIRKVTNVSNMEEKNRDERFEEAFKGVPKRIWTVFEQPEELYALVDELRFGKRL